MTTKIAIATDHRGINEKTSLIQKIISMGYEAINLGADEETAVDYPDYAKKVVDCVASGEADYGVLICGSGIGMSIAANRNPKIRAAIAYNNDIARLCRQHNNANVLVLGVSFIDNPEELLEIFLTTEFEGGRHAKRVEKL